MNEKIRLLLDQMAALEEDLRQAVHEQEASVLFQIKGKRVEFEASIQDARRRLKTGFFRWVVTYRPHHLQHDCSAGDPRFVCQFLPGHVFPDLPRRQGAPGRLHRV
jgi:hypothetical protein